MNNNEHNVPAGDAFELPDSGTGSIEIIKRTIGPLVSAVLADNYPAPVPPVPEHLAPYVELKRATWRDDFIHACNNPALNIFSKGNLNELDENAKKAALRLAESLAMCHAYNVQKADTTSPNVAEVLQGYLPLNIAEHAVLQLREKVIVLTQKFQKLSHSVACKKIDPDVDSDSFDDEDIGFDDIDLGVSQLLLVRHLILLAEECVLVSMTTKEISNTWTHFAGQDTNVERINDELVFTQVNDQSEILSDILQQLRCVLDDLYDAYDANVDAFMILKDTPFYATEQAIWQACTNEPVPLTFYLPGTEPCL